MGAGEEGGRRGRRWPGLAVAGGRSRCTLYGQGAGALAGSRGKQTGSGSGSGSGSV